MNGSATFAMTTDSNEQIKQVRFTFEVEVQVQESKKGIESLKG